MQKEKVLVAMSGGVDSAVSALILQENGYDCVGATMKLTPPAATAFQSTKSCCNPEELQQARAIADRLGIFHHVIDLSKDFCKHVVDYFVQTYLCGATPNPCVVCNQTMKFGKLLQVAADMGCDKLATGHYAQIEKNAGGRMLLKTARDPSKDQTYVLWTLTQEQLAHTVFPLGELLKSQVRELALSHGFENAQKKDSQDVCFVPDGDYVAFIERYTQKKYPKGLFLDINGNTLGEHQGMIRYTIGQRKGLGIAFGEPTYVCSKDARQNTVTLGKNEDLFERDLTASKINLIALPTLDRPMRVQAKIRYRAAAADAWVEQLDKDRVRVRFDEPQRAISPGQSLVLYDGSIVLGGGIID